MILNSAPHICITVDLFYKKYILPIQASVHPFICFILFRSWLKSKVYRVLTSKTNLELCVLLELWFCLESKQRGMNLVLVPVLRVRTGESLWKLVDAFGYFVGLWGDSCLEMILQPPKSYVTSHHLAILHLPYLSWRPEPATSQHTAEAHPVADPQDLTLEFIWTRDKILSAPGRW